MPEKIVLLMLKGAGFILALFLFLLLVLYSCCGCGRQKAHFQYHDRMKYAGASSTFGGGTITVYIDTETGVCYAAKGNHLIMLVDHNGDPYIANGWRDGSAED